MANVLYVVWWEGVRRSGILDNQVYRLAARIGTHTPHHLTLLSGGAFWRGRCLRFLQKRKPGWRFAADRSGGHIDTRQLRARLEAAGVDVVFRETLVSPRSVYLRWWQVVVYPLPHLFYFARLARRLSLDVVHCRSYYPTLLALLSRRMFGGRYRIVFDTRGLLPDEGVATGIFPAGGLSYRLWKRVERGLFEGVDMVVNVSDPFSEYVQAQASVAVVRTVYAAVDLTAFASAGQGGAAANTPVPASVFAGRRVLVYLGSISKTGWHSITYLARLYALFKFRFSNPVLLVITSGGHAAVRAGLVSNGVDEQALVFESAASIEAVAARMQGATYAALPYRHIRGESDLRVAQTMISSKMEEYLAAGVPVLCNRNIAGAARLLGTYGVGYAVDLDQPDMDQTRKWEDPDKAEGLRDRCRAVAQRFSLHVICDEYASIYEELGGR